MGVSGVSAESWGCSAGGGLQFPIWLVLSILGYAMETICPRKLADQGIS